MSKYDGNPFGDRISVVQEPPKTDWRVRALLALATEHHSTTGMFAGFDGAQHMILVCASTDHGVGAMHWPCGVARIMSEARLTETPR